MTQRIYLAGEGRTELGGWVDAVPYREGRPALGVLEALLKRIKRDGWVVIDGLQWKGIRKYKAGARRQSETRNVMGLALHAHEAKCGLLVISRDRDRQAQREIDVEAGIQQARRDFPSVKIAGGVAAQAVEAWVLAMMGDLRAEDHAKPKATLEERNVRRLEAMIEIIEGWEMPEAGATSLHRWIDSVRATFAEMFTP